MRVARLVGLSPDGRFVIVSTDRGEDLAIAADDRLRAAVRGRPAASEKLEIEMESALSPREIQTRIRSGESVADVSRVAGVDADRVERFAAPVIAEREHVAGLAMSSSARRRGETSAHRTLRGVLQERLLNRGVDVDTVRWDSYRMDDGRWTVTADYLSGETPRQAVFYFDVAGRFSVAGNDDARWILGDVSPSRGRQPGRRPPAPGLEDDGTEPTLDLSDELALVRAIQDIPPAPPVDLPTGAPASETDVPVTEADLDVAEMVPFTPPAGLPAGPPAGPDDDLDAELAAVESDLDALDAMFADQSPEQHPALGDHGPAGPPRGPSDASAVPELSPVQRLEAWEPAIVIDYPVEPSEDPGGLALDVEVAEGSDDPGRPEPAVARDDRRDEAEALEHEGAAQATAEPEDQPLPIEVPEQPAPSTPARPARRKRASVPSWDEIVFGGPRDTT